VGVSSTSGHRQGAVRTAGCDREARARSLAGFFDPGGQRSSEFRCSLAIRALDGREATVLETPHVVAACSPRVGRRIESELPWCLLDGRLHNASELVHHLGLGPGAGQDELLVAAFACWGPGMLERLRGEFAFVLWDPVRHQGMLARDHMGTRSLVFHETGDRLWFGTDVRELVRLLPRRPAPDHTALVHWLVMSTPAAGATMFEGLRRVEPGHAVLLDATGWRVVRYWAPRFREPLRRSRSELVDAVREGLRTSVRRRLEPGHPTAVLVSGGLDSTSVAALAHDLAPGEVLTASVSFPEYPNTDESFYVDRLNEALGTPSLRLRAADGRGMVRSAAEYLRAWDLPLHAWSESWGQPLMREIAAEGAKAVLAGDGGDELFGSRYYLIADRLRRGDLRGAVRLVRRIAEAGGVPPREWQLRWLWQFGFQAAVPWRVHDLVRQVYPSGAHMPWLLPDSAGLLAETRDTFDWQRLDGPRWWAGLVDALISKPHSYGLIDHGRRRAAQAGLDARNVLYDIDLVELALTLPPLSCFDAHLSRPLFRDAVAGLSPDKVRLRPDKVVFDAPIVDALRGPELPAIRRLLGQRDAEILAYVDGTHLRDLLREDAPDKASQPWQWAIQLWRLTTAEMWLRSQSDPAFVERWLDGDEAVQPLYELKRFGATKEAS
jgi:asparagine synthase (glutamine-hydrolysing)